MTRNSETEQSDEITLPASEKAIPTLIDFVSMQARECDFNEQAIKDIGLAVQEVLWNIIRFACQEGDTEIKISCTVHSGGALIVTISDTGSPFNMLLTSTFPEAEDFIEGQEKPSTKIMKKIVGNLEYRRDAKRNILILTIWQDPKKRR